MRRRRRWYAAHLRQAPGKSAHVAGLAQHRWRRYDACRRRRDHAHGHARANGELLHPTHHRRRAWHGAHVVHEARACHGGARLPHRGQASRRNDLAAGLHDAWRNAGSGHLAKSTRHAADAADHRPAEEPRESRLRLVLGPLHLAILADVAEAETNASGVGCAEDRLLQLVGLQLRQLRGFLLRLFGMRSDPLHDAALHLSLLVLRAHVRLRFR
mmetsp:Transcript_53990/g.155877  ORF Transcript_53990/g.155877 Transcript_53990/m.155877 type:complete len:214 (+) Transcript_53990:1079-1720(+)